MHSIEPFYHWRNYYQAEEDVHSPFYKREYDLFNFNNTVYNYCIHAQWDSIGSPTLYIKILYVDYHSGIAVIEMLGEWNDSIHNDIMYLKREVIDPMIDKGIDKYVLIGENIFNFHHSDFDYYEEWNNELHEGWIIGLHFSQHVLDEFHQANIHHYIQFIDKEELASWRTDIPSTFCHTVQEAMKRRIE